MKLRIFCGTLLTLLLFSSCVFAAKPSIRADQQYLDINSGLYVLKGNVCIETSGRTIKAGQAQINLASMEVWGSGGVSIEQEDINFSGNEVYIYGGQNKAAYKSYGGRSSISHDQANVRKYAILSNL